MSIADILISFATFLIQKLILPLLPTNLPLISFATFNALLNGSMKHNLAWSFAGLDQFMNLQLVFILLGSIIFAETIFWLVRVALFIVKFFRGGG